MSSSFSRFDASGWSVDPVQPLSREEAYSLFTADASARFDVHLLVPPASAQLGLDVRVEPAKRFLKGAFPMADVATLHFEGEGFTPSSIEARIFPIERAGPLKALAKAAGSHGMETLVTRARKVLQLRVGSAQGDDRVAIACATLFAAAFLAAVLPPREDVLFGTKGAKERLEAARDRLV